MADMLKLTWWYLLLRGGVAILFALIVLAFPEEALLSSAILFVFLFSAYALIDGGSTIAAALRQREGHWFALLVWGIISIVGAIAVLIYPLVAAAFALRVFALIIGLRALITGIYEMITAWRLRDDIEDEWFLGLSGLFSVLFGFILLLRPFGSLAVLALFVGFYTLIYGVLLVMLAFKVRGWSEAIADIKGLMQPTNTIPAPATVPSTPSDSTANDTPAMITPPDDPAPMVAPPVAEDAVIEPETTAEPINTENVVLEPDDSNITAVDDPTPDSETTLELEAAVDNDTTTASDDTLEAPVKVAEEDPAVPDEPTAMTADEDDVEDTLVFPQTTADVPIATDREVDDVSEDTPGDDAPSDPDSNTNGASNKDNI